MKPLKTMLIGLGRMGQNHMRVIEASPSFQLTSVVDPKANPKFLSPSVKLYSKADDVPPTDWDVAIIAASSGAHYALADQLMNSKKTILVEKPLATNAVDSAKLLQKAAQTKSLVAVGHLERFNPAVLKLKEIIESGLLGKIIHFSFTRVGGYPSMISANDNVLLDLAVHDLDVLYYLQGPMEIAHCLSHSSYQPGISDTAEILVKTKKGTSASLHVNWVSPTKIRTIRITGTNGVCFVDYILQKVELYGGNLLKRSPEASFNFHSIIEEYRASDKVEFGILKEEPLKIQYQEFYKFATGAPSRICTIQEAHDAVLLADQALKVSV